MKCCARCGREGVKAFVRHVERIGGVDVELWRCSNTGACAMREGRSDLGRLVDLRVVARRVALGFPLAEPEGRSP